jgi:hypothetical protein
MKVAIIGSRDFGWDMQGKKPSVENNYWVGVPDASRHRVEFIAGCVVKMTPEDYVYSGDATGADHWAEYWARMYRVGRNISPAWWEKYGPSAGPIRNPRVINEADVVLAFFTDKSKSRGTVQAIGIADKRGIPVYEFDALTEARPTWYDTWYEEVSSGM